MPISTAIGPCFFSHPADFTPVCTTELGETAKLKAEFDKRNVKVLALSVDTADSHTRWIPDINETQKTEVNFPILADADKSVAILYGMLHPQSLDNLTVRSVFVIDPAKKIRLTLTYPASTGRNFKEILRVIDSLQLTDKHRVATPGQLAGRRGRGDPPFHQGSGRGRKAVPQGVQDRAAVSASHPPAQPLKRKHRRNHEHPKHTRPPTGRPEHPHRLHPGATALRAFGGR